MKAIAHIITLTFILISSMTIGQVTERERPEEWDNLVFGGRFLDRFLPMPDLGGKTEDTWGAENVIPRDINNGLEDEKWSYWGGNARLLDDGKYHLFVCRWAENAPKGHMAWPNSHVVHATAQNSFGPYTVIEEIGKGHNPEWYITKNGKFVIYVYKGYYISDNINGPWSYNAFEFNNRDRKIIEGLSNLTFAKREDGSFVMVCRGGGVWISQDGISTWNQITDSRVYPPVDGRFEDPLIWKTDVQYHLIVNDWLGRIAWYMRSKDGIHWKTEPGEAYLPGIAKYEDNTNEDWFKYERIKVIQDEYGRATQAHFAVIDTLKHFDLANDNHSSKHITIPLRKGKLMTVLNTDPITSRTKEIEVKIKAEKGFDPKKDIAFESLRFGASNEVNYGKGSTVKEIKEDGKDVIIIFEGKANGLTEENFAAKLLGKDKKNELLFAYARLPGVDYIKPVLSARKPTTLSNGSELMIEVQNFGQVKSEEATLQINEIVNEKTVEIASATIPPLRPYEKQVIKLKCSLSNKTNPQFSVMINKDKEDAVLSSFN